MVLSRPLVGHRWPRAPAAKEALCNLHARYSRPARRHRGLDVRGRDDKYPQRHRRLV